MDTVNQIIDLLKFVVIPAGVIFRVIFCLVKMIYDDEAGASYKKKIRNTVAFGLFAELCFVFKDLIVEYYR